MLGKWGQSAGKAPCLSSPLKLGEWRVMRCGGAQPRSGVEVEGGMNHVGGRGSRRQETGSGGGSKGRDEAGLVLWPGLSETPPHKRRGSSPWGTAWGHLAPGLRPAQSLEKSQPQRPHPETESNAKAQAHSRPTKSECAFSLAPQGNSDTHWSMRTNLGKNIPSTCSLTHPEYIHLQIPEDFPWTWHQEDVPGRAG